MAGYSIKQKVFSWLRIRTLNGGLEVTDQIVRLVVQKGGTMKTSAVRLAPGILRQGKIIDQKAFREALASLRASVNDVKRPGHKIDVAVVLSSTNIYSQVFTLPIVKGSDFKKAVELNVQMLSPMDASQTYYGWQMLGRDEKIMRSEMLASFAEKQSIDEMSAALFDTGFLAISVESRALALARLVRQFGSGIDATKSYLMITIGNAGLQFLVLRHGQLYFEFGSTWETMMDEKGNIGVEQFTGMLLGDFRQVLNFYEQHWPEPFDGILLGAAAFQDVAVSALRSVSSTPIVPLVLTGGVSSSPEWYIAFGGSLRSQASDEINLLGGGARDIYHEEQMISFLGFWKVVMPAAFAILLAAYVLANSFLVKIKNEALVEEKSFNVSSTALEALNTAEASATAFNNAVSMLASIEGEFHPKYVVIQDLENLAQQASVQITHISLQQGGGSMVLSGSAPSEDAIVSFKAAVQNDHRFGTVSLPITNIQQNGAVFTFSMSFPVSADAFTP